jgi:hypothetical protein
VQASAAGTFLDVARALGLDEARFLADLDGPVAAARVRDDMLLARGSASTARRPSSSTAAMSAAIAASTLWPPTSTPNLRRPKPCWPRASRPPRWSTPCARASSPLPNLIRLEPRDTTMKTISLPIFLVTALALTPPP